MTTFLVTGASGFVGSHVVSELLREGYTVRGYVLIPQSYTIGHPVSRCQCLPRPTGVVSSVRGHNVARVNKGYESFGDRFVVVSLTAWSRRTWWHMRYAGPSVPVSSYLMAEHILGVNSVIYVASLLPFLLLQTSLKSVAAEPHCRPNKILFLDRGNWDHSHTRHCSRRRHKEARHHREQRLADRLHGPTAYSRLTREDALKPGVTGFGVYMISKSLSNLTVCNSKEDHPDFDIMSIHPSCIFGAG
ncbi:hypothetical protein EDB86DRAFT_206714 [Lactarius hatsudake]|nr:hypothetical protein EDB86DRAFT_206714 [Lactarius hatsudake]